jgi:tetratricopeptide (TPR) repeat protein
VRIVAKCQECGFDNPRGWVSCARCGELLGPRLRRSDSQAPPEETTTTSVRADGLDRPREERSGDGPEADAKTALFRPDELPSRDSRPLMGQAHVVGRLRRAIDRAFSTASPQLVALEGGPGAGKTRLLQRAGELAARRERAVVHYAASGPRDEGPFAPVSRLLLDRFGITPSSAPAAVRTQMTEAVGQALDSDDAARVTETTHLLGHVAGVPFPDSPVLRMLEADPDALGARAAAAVADLAEGEARDAPQLWLLDGVGADDAPVWEVLRALLQVRAPLAIVVAGEPPLAERVDALDAGDRASTAELLPLSGGEVGQLIRKRVPGLRALPDALLRAVLHHTAGNPGRVVTLVAALQDGGLFQSTRRGVEVDMARLQAGDLPLDADDALRARLATLDEEALGVLRHAAVVGERFWDGALLALARDVSPPPDAATLTPIELWDRDRDELSLSDALSRLSDLGLIECTAEPLTPGLGEYVFAVEGARAVLYAGLDEATRTRGHRVVSRWLSAPRGLAAEGLSALLASHLERAGNAPRAARAHLRAAEDERSRMRTAAALRHVDRCLSLLEADDVPLRFDALHMHGSLLATLGRYDESYAAFAQLARLAFQVGARGAGGAALNRIARLHRGRGEHDEALTHLRMALRLFRAADDLRGVASTYDDMAQVHRLRGDIEPALAAAREALEIRTRTRDRRGQGVSLNTLGRIELDRGGFDAAREHLETARRIREEIGDFEDVAQTRIALGRLAFHRGDLEHAVERFGEALEAARAMDQRRFQSYVLSHLAEARIQLGELAQAEQSLRQAKELAFEMRDQRALAEVERILGMLLLERGEAAARDTLQRALELAREYGTREAIALAHRALGQLGARTLHDDAGAAPDPAETEGHFRECIQILDEAGHRPEAARTRAELGRFLMERGESKQARELLEPALRVLRELRLPETEPVKTTLRELNLASV